MPTTVSSVASLVMDISRTRAATMDLPVALTAVCAALPEIVGVAGAVLLVIEPVDACFGSDSWAYQVGEAQRRAGQGPLPAAVSGEDRLMVPDLTRADPPTLAVVAREFGYFGSMVLALEMDGERVGALQLLGDAARPIYAGYADQVRLIVEVLAARLLDVRDLRRPAPAPVVDVPTSKLPVVRAVVPFPRRNSESVGSAAPEEGAPSSARPRRARTGSHRRVIGTMTNDRNLRE